MADEEWTTVRRRRSSIPSRATALNKKLAIPVVPLAFGVLEIEKNALQDAERQKEAEKKRKRKENKAKLAAEQRAMQQPTTGAQDKAAAVAAPSSKGSMRGASSGPGGSASGGLADSLMQWLAMLLCGSLLRALLTRLKSLLGLEAKKKKKSKSQQPPAGAAAAAATAAAAAETEEKKADQNTAAAASQVRPSTGVKAKATSSSGGGQLSTPSREGAREAASVTEAGQGPAAAASSKDSSRPLQEPSVVVKPKPAPPPPSAPAADPPPAKAKAAAEQKPSDKQAKQPPPPPCDADWAQGHFMSAVLPAAHPDVIASVALVGDVALSSGYDGAIKVWNWQPGSPLELTRNLTGHSGRVEALALEATARRAASSGRDSTLKVWDLARESSGAVASYYVYDSVRCMALDWASSTAALGCASGAVALWDIERGRKLQVLKGHGDEVCSLLMRGDGSLISGSKDAEVYVWDVRTSPATRTAVMQGLRGRACSLSSVDHLLYVGDCSSTIKVFDLRSGSELLQPTCCIPNTPAFAGDICPVAALHRDVAGRVLISSSIGWWTENKLALEEAPEDAEYPIACLNVHACHPQGRDAANGPAPDSAAAYQYQYTLRVCPGIATCMAVGSSSASSATTRVLVGTSGGTLVGLTLVRGRAKAAAAGVVLEEGIPVGVEELSDDDESEEEDE